MKKIKLLCTLGPSSFDKGTVVKLDELGVDIFRINLSHTEIKDLKGLIARIRQYTDKPICLDTEGAQVRTGYVKNKRIFLEEGAYIEITKRKIIGDAKKIPLNPSTAVDQLRPGDMISVDFDSVILLVTVSDKRHIKAKIVSGGYVGSNKAVTVDRRIKLPVVSEKDKKAVKIGLRYGIRHFALSFADSKEAVRYFRKLARRKIFLISKIESKEGVGNLDGILSVSDAILIDRGDLSREEPIEKIPFIQKLIIKKANARKVPVYVATNLLESMVKDKKPTRAEASDVINTLIDGADGLVLAAETAIGAHPIPCAVMISRMVEGFMDHRGGSSLEELQRRESFFVVEPNGGLLVNRVNDCFDMKNLSRHKTLAVDRRVLLNAEQIALGTFSPLEGFMNKREVEAVIRNYRLPGGAVWTLPIVLQVDKSCAKGFNNGDDVLLTLDEDGKPYAVLHAEDIYSYDTDKFSREVFGTNSPAHPGAALFKRKGNCFIGGKIELIRRLPSECKHYEITPRQARAIFENRGWSRVVGFHTRNVIHRVHERIQMLALEKFHCDGILLHPAVGPKKKGDYTASAILKGYEAMIEGHYPKGRTLLAAFQTYSRYAGPREAVFTALCRKNFGCSHFIVGRDHTGVGNFYGPNDAHRLFGYLGDIGIVPIFFNSMHYCRKCGDYIEKCTHGERDILSISGTKGRDMIRSGQCPPDWFMRRDISRLILNDIKTGGKVFVE